MSRRSRIFLFGTVTLLGLAGCSTYVMEQRPIWRTKAEQACLARNAGQESSYIRAAAEMSGPGICGLTRPFKVTALAGGTVMLNSTATLDCSMIEALDTWIKDVLQPSAMARFGEPVVRINSMGSYACRGINNVSGASLSEHSFGNAMDIGAFVLASGREVNILHDFNGSDEQGSAFLHEAHAGACSYFTTVLGPGYNALHNNHFHIDLAMHGSTSHGPRRYCKPVPEQGLPEPPQRDNLPDPPPIEEEMDIARAPTPAPGLTAGGSTFVSSVPQAPPTTRAAAYTPVPRSGQTEMARAPEPGRQRTPPGPPVVTFADVDPPQPPASALNDTGQVTQRPPRQLMPPSAPAGSLDEPQESGGGMGEASPESEAPPARVPDQTASQPFRKPRPPEGLPTDWDATSSIR